MLVASFDIGKKNFSFYVEKFDKYVLKTPLKKRYNPNGTCTNEFQIEVNNVCKIGEKIILENVDITEGCDPKSKLEHRTFYNMTTVLDSFKEIWDHVDLFVIEKQMQFGMRVNPMAIKLGQHCYSYFSFNYGMTKEILEFPAYHKTQVLGSEKIASKRKTKAGKTSYKAIDKPARKKWCIAKAIEIMKLRNDNETLDQINSSKKKDDLCDVICQLQSWKILNC